MIDGYGNSNIFKKIMKTVREYLGIWISDFGIKKSKF